MNSPKRVICVCSALIVLFIVGLWGGSHFAVATHAQTTTAQIKLTPIRSDVFGWQLWPIENGVLSAADDVELAYIFDAVQSAFDRGAVNLADTYDLRVTLQKTTVDELERFITAKPSSRWVCPLRNVMGHWYWQHGQITKALVHFEAAWNQSKDYQSSLGKAEANTAFAAWTRLLVLLSRVDVLDDVFAEHGARLVQRGPHSQTLRATHEKVLRIHKYPQESFKCGVHALDKVATVLGYTYPQAQLLNTPGKSEGFSLKELQDLSEKYDFKMRAAKRTEKSAAIPVPSVIHWSQLHYGAILSQKGNRFRIWDFAQGGFYSLTADEINSEATGFFLVPASQIGIDFQQASTIEAAAVFGRASSCAPNSIDDDGCSTSSTGGGGGGGGSSGGGAGFNWDQICKRCNPGGGGGGPGGGGGSGGGDQCCKEDSDPSNGGGSRSVKIGARSPGMVSWEVSEPYIDIWLRDTPLHYQPSKGPAVSLELHFKPLEQGSRFGIGWSSTWDSQVQFLTPDEGYWVTPGGAQYLISFSSDTLTNYHKNATLTRLRDGNGAIIGILATFPSGHQYKYAQYKYLSGWSMWYLTEEIDPSGNKLTFGYNSVNRDILETVTDADANVTTITRQDNVGADLHTEYTITDPSGKYAVLAIEAGTTDLVKITDSAGIVSTMAYFGYNGPSSLTTPYGTTYFTPDYQGYTFDRSMIVTLPTGGKHVWVLIDSATSGQIAYTNFNSSQLPTNTPFATVSYPSGYMDVNNRRDRNTIYWNPSQFASCSTTNLTDLVWNDLKKGRIRHWLWKVENTYNHVDTLAYEQLPSAESGSNVAEGQVIFYDHDGKSYSSPEIRGTQVKPAVIATVMPDGSTVWKWTKRNGWGKGTEVIEKWVQNSTDTFRTNTFSYSTDGIDLVEHRFKATGIDKLIEGYGYSDHLPTSKTNALNEVTSWTYNTSKQLLTFKNPAGMVSSNTYGGDGYISKTVVFEDGIGPVSTNQYTWLYGNLRTHTDPRGLIITNTWDGLNRLTKVEFPDGSYIQHTYTNGLGTNLLHRTYTRDRMANATRWTYTPLQQVETVTDPLGTVAFYQYCDCGALESVTRAYGTALAETTGYLYDNQMRLLRTDLPDGSWKTNAYDSLGRMTIGADPLGLSTNTFDNLGRTLCASNAFGQVFAASYDIEGNVTNRTDGNGVTIAMTYDALDRIRTRTYPDTGVEAWGYTANISGPTSYTNQLSKVTTYAYDKLGRKNTEIIVGLATNTFFFSPANDLLTLTDGKSQTTTWAYDLYGRVATKKYADGNTNLIYSYDASSRLTNRWSAAKGNTRYAYDANGNLTSIDYPSSPDVTIQYDALNRSTNETVAGLFTSAFTYHPGGALQTEDGPWASDTITYYTNTAGLRSGLSIQQPAGSFTNGYAYDAAHRLTNLTSHAGSFTYDYYATNGGLTASTHLIRKLTLPPGSYITNSFDNNARETETRLMTGANIELNDHAYLYNVGNQRSQQTYTDDAYVTYTYDDAGELRTAYTTNSGAEIAAQRYMYGYDAAWNMTKRTNNVTATTYSVNNLNQNTTSYTSYDSNGNPTARATSTTLQYDDENRLISIFEDPIAIPGGRRSDFAYDARGRLRKRTTFNYNAASGFWNVATETRYIYDGMLLVQDRDINNAPQTTYTRGADLSGTIQGAGGIGGLLARSTSYQSGTGNWNTSQYYHSDGNGNITYLMATNETLAASYRYDPFGRTITSSGTFAGANLMRFSSKLIFTEWTLYYYGYRFYDPNSQRWLNRDPIFESSDRNLYRFVHNAPAFRVDADGRVDCAVGCEIAKNNPNVRNDEKGKPSAGGVICFDGQPCACVWQDQGGLSDNAYKIIKSCIQAHEDAHKDNSHNKKCNICSPGPTRPAHQGDPQDNECVGYTAEYECLLGKRALCGGDAACENEIKATLDGVFSEMSANCPIPPQKKH